MDAKEALVVSEMMAPDDILRFNVGGKLFMTKLQTLRSVGVGKLGKISIDDPAYDKKAGEFFFDRDPVFFSKILQFYRTGELHIPDGCCIKTIRSELKYWELGVEQIGDCCWGNYCKAKEHFESTNRLTRHLQSFVKRIPIASNTPYTCKQKLWLFLENPTSSLPAKIWAGISVVLLITSILCYALTTLPEAKRAYASYFGRNNNSEWSEEELQYSSNFLFIVTVIDTCCLSFFTIDLLLRVFSAPRKTAFFTSFLFYCDLFFLIPGWLLDVIILTESRILVDLSQHHNVVIIIIQIITVTRLFRIFRLAGYFQGIRILLYVLKASMSELLLLGVFISMGVLLYGFLIYGAEVGESNNFDSAFRGFWWAIITMSTVGYGDYYPISTLGYIIAALCAISGLIIVGLPIPIIASNFDLYYGFQIRNNEALEADSKVAPSSDKGDNDKDS